MNSNLKKVLVLGLVVLITVAVGSFIFMRLDAGERATVTAGDTRLSVRIADTVMERKRGLSGYELETLKADGMLFVFSKSGVQNFWMKGMNFPLDVVWLKDGRVVGVETDIPAPKPGEEPARMTSEPLTVNAVLELPAGGVKKAGIVMGMQLNIEYP